MLRSKPFIHPQAICESEEVGSGTRIWAFAHVSKHTRIGSHCNICEQVFIESGVTVGSHCVIKNGVSLWEGVTLEDHVFVGPGVIFTNDKFPRTFKKNWKEQGFKKTLIQQGATLGGGSSILCGVTVGKFSFIGMGAVVTKDIPDHALAVGNPARIIGKVCFCGMPLAPEDHCKTCQKKLSENSFENFKI